MDSQPPAETARWTDSESRDVTGDRVKHVLKYVGGVMRPGYAMSLPEADLVKLPGFGNRAP